MSDNGLLAVLETATKVVREASSIARNGFRQSLVVQMKAGSEPVTQIDIQVDQIISAALLESFPDHGIISEESEPINADAEFVWLLDPIDGTKQFCRGVPIYAISLALRHNSDIVLGIVYAVETDEMFTAVKGQGAHLNGEPIACPVIRDPADAVICADLPGRLSPPDIRAQAVDNVRTIVESCARFRLLGSSALGLSYCAAGGFDIYLNLGRNTKIWDVAAGQILIREAGGTYTETAKENLVAGHQSIHDAMIGFLDL